MRRQIVLDLSALIPLDRGRLAAQENLGFHRLSQWIDGRICHL